jgi:hypothetical protein
MTRQEVFTQITQAFGLVPGWLEAIPEAQLEEQWGLVSWMGTESSLSSRDKWLAALGASSAIHCHY